MLSRLNQLTVGRRIIAAFAAITTMLVVLAAVGFVTINQKRLDALAMLEEMRDFLATDPPPAPFDHTFERTIYWDQAAAYWDRAEAVYAEGDESAKATLLVALRLRMAECEHFGEEELTQLIWAIIAINAWNRLAVATRMLPGEYVPS